MHLSKEEFLKHVVDAIGPDLCPINQVFQKLPKSLRGTFNDCDKFSAFISKQSDLFDRLVIGKTIYVQKKAELTDDSQCSSPSVSNVATSKTNTPVSKQQLETYVKDAIGSGSCQINQVFEALPTCAKGSFQNLNALTKYLKKRPHIADLEGRNSKVWVKRKSQVNDKTETKHFFPNDELTYFKEESRDSDTLLQVYMKSHLDSEHMLITYVGEGTSRRMVLLYKAKGLPVDMKNFDSDKKYYVVPDEGINWKSMVEKLKIEDILFDFINFLSRSQKEWGRIRDFNNLMTELECFHYGLSNKKPKDYDMLLTIFQLFPNLFTIEKFIISGSSFTMKAKLKEDDEAFLTTLSIAAKVCKNSSLAIFHALPNYCKMKFSDYDDFCTYFLHYKVELDFLNHWKETRHSPDNSVIHFEEGRFYLLFKFKTFQHLSFEDISKSPSFFCVPNVGFHFKPFIDRVNLDKLLVKFIRFKIGHTQWVARQQMIDDYVSIINEYPDTEKYNNILALTQIANSLTETIIELFPTIWKTTKWGVFSSSSDSIKLVHDIPDCQPTRERLILEILRVEQRAKPTSMKLLYKALPDYARHQFSSPLKLQEFCQEIIALQDEFTYFQEEPSLELTMKNIKSELQTLAKASESIDENSNEDLQGFIRRLSLLSKKAEAFGQLKNEEFLCQELEPTTDESIGDNSVIEI